MNAQPLKIREANPGIPSSGGTERIAYFAEEEAAPVNGLPPAAFTAALAAGIREVFEEAHRRGQVLSQLTVEFIAPETDQGEEDWLLAVSSVWAPKKPEGG